MGDKTQDDNCFACLSLWWWLIALGFCLPIRYLIPSLDRSHAGHYRCIVRNRVGAIMQCSTEVQVACKWWLIFIHLADWGDEAVLVKVQHVTRLNWRRTLIVILSSLLVSCGVHISFYFLTFIYYLCLPDMGGFVEGERSQTVSQGEGALIHAPRIHSFPRPQITWFRDGRKIPSSSRMWVRIPPQFVCFWIEQKLCGFGCARDVGEFSSCCSRISFSSESSKKFNTARWFSPIPPHAMNQV